MYTIQLWSLLCSSISFICNKFNMRKCTEALNCCCEAWLQCLNMIWLWKYKVITWQWNFNVGHNFCNIEDSNLIFGMHVYLTKLHILSGIGSRSRSSFKVKNIIKGSYKLYINSDIIWLSLKMKNFRPKRIHGGRVLGGPRGVSLFSDARRWVCCNIHYLNFWYFFIVCFIDTSLGAFLIAPIWCCTK